MGRIDRLRRQHREDLVVEMPVEPFAVGVADLVLAEHDHAGLAQRRRSSAQTPCWLAVSASASAAIAASCWPGVRPSAEVSSTPSNCWRLEAGDPDHEEFVEIVARDREEAEPLEQRMGSLRASSSTRRLKASQDSSRLK